MSRCAALAVVLVLSAPASGATFATGPVFTPLALTLGAHLECLVTNFGTRPVRVREAAAVDDEGAAVELPNASCVGELLAPGATCLLATSAGVARGAVRLEVQGSVKGLRGSCKLIDGATIHDESDFR